MTDTVEFLLLSDLHVSHRAPADAGLLTDTSATLDEVIERISTLDRRPAFVVIAGDLTNHGEPDAYRALAAMLGRIELPLLLALGNHDTRSGFRAVMLADGSDPDAPYYYETVLAGVHLIVLDSSLPGRISGGLEDKQIAFLDAALDKQPGLPRIVVCHHPPHLDDQEPGWHSLDPASTARLAAVVGGGRVAAILSGHVHHDSVIHWHGVPVVTGTGLHNAADATFEGGLRVVDGAGFTLCRLRPSGLSASFVPLARSRRELRIYPLDWLNERDRGA